MLKIRLRRVGKRHQPSYRVVVIEHTAPAQGSYLEMLGSYNPRAHRFTVKEDRLKHWLDHGAQPSERMAKLLTTAGVSHKLIVLPDFDRKPKRAPKKAQPEAAAPTAKAATEEAAAETPAAQPETPTTETPVEEAAATETETPAAEESTAETSETQADESAPVEDGSTPPADAAPETE